jgi:type IV pilus assembly protein PilB
VHIEPQRARSRVRFRLDGELKEVASFPIEIHNALISRVKILSNLKIDETRVPQDGRFRSVVFGKDIDFRVSTFPTPTGEKVAIRVLDPSVGLKGMDSLGLQGKNAEVVKEALNKPYGMVLVSGPTGSGKTTTLYALLQTLNNEDSNVLSLEDPVEYFVDGINQSQMKPEIGYTFASGLRQTLRQDPDIIMVGEIRDGETAELAVQAALTGHIVLSTLHTNTAVGVIPRLIDMGVEPFLLPSALNLMVAQRLVRKICSKCRQAKEAPKSVQDVIAKEMAALPEDVKKTVGFTAPYVTYYANGCESCKGKGIEGRVALFEIVAMNRELANLVTTKFSQGELQDAARKQGLVSLRQDGILKALAGLVSIEEVLRESDES